MINWKMSEPELLDMLVDKYECDGYAVDLLHNRRELGVDIIATKEDEQIAILAKINPVQADLSQPVVAKQNYPDATSYIYYFVGVASAPFLNGMTAFPDFTVYNQAQTEQIMLQSNSIYAFRFLLKYSPTADRIARLIQKAYSDETGITNPDLEINSATFQSLLVAHEAIIQMREVITTAITSIQDLINAYTDDYSNEQLITKMATVSHQYISKLDNISDKLDRLLLINSHYINGFFKGTPIWGGTINGEFIPLHLEQNSWGRYGTSNERRHYYKILDVMICGFRERYPYYDLGVTEIIGCFMCLEDIVKSLKRSTERLVISAYENK